MAVFSVHYLLLAASLLFVATLCTAQDPPRTCFDTGLTCINDCVGQTDGVHQWCGDCNYYVSCNGDIAYIQPCPADTYYSDDVQACVADSNTCTECIIYAGSTTPPPATPPVDAICGSTGPECIDHCDQTNNGIYQWCGRCDYFIQCSGSSSYWTECQPGLEYDHTVQACVYNSTTCTQSPCYDDLSTTPAPNVCTSSPCAFGGTCIQIPGGDYDCICAPGYTGFNCSQVINYCNSNPCVNGATCLPIIDGYVCQCPPGYTGPLCQYVINNCQSLPCMNGGTCHNQIDGYVCVCPPEWTGERCNTLVDPCGSLPCINGGTCVNNCGFPQCICPPGWTGVSCDTYVDNCASDPCQNGGSCQNGLNQWTCICPPSFTGTRCESVVDICTSHPCQNGGTCVFDCGIYQCVCPDGWTGYNCQTPLTACDPTNPCYNGGTCIPNGGSFTCACSIDFTGFLCESPNYEERLVCGSTLEYSGYPASNGFTRLCFWYAAPNDLERRAVECRFTIHGIPLYDDYTGLLTAGGNFGCIVSQNYPDDLPGTSLLACSDYYQHDVSLGPYNESTHLMVCLRYPYEGIPDPGKN